MTDELLLFRCGTCIYFDDLSTHTNMDKPFGHCRRYAPKTENFKSVADRFQPVVTKWPRVLVDDWCGEWKNKD